MKHFLILLAFILLIEANELENKVIKNFEYINSLEKGIKRDFYINEYLKQNISSSEAYNILFLIDNFTNEIFYNFAKKFAHDETLAVALCMNMSTEELVDSYADCIVSGLSIKDASKLSAVDLDLIMQKTSLKYPIFTKRLKVFSSSIPFTKLIVSKKDEFYNIFLNVDDDFRTKYFDYKLPKRTFQKIFSDKKNFEKFLQISLINPKLHKLQKSLLEIDDSKLDDNSSFLLALNSIRFNDLNKAMIYLENANKKTNNQKFKDKIQFWKYQITKDIAYLEELSNSLNLNLYSLYANEFLNKKLEDFNFLQKMNDFDSLLDEYDINRVSMLYSLAKVKSDFNSSKISKDFELGIMQLNNKLISSLYSTIEENETTFDPFLIKDSLNLANIHLNNIEKNSINPIFLTLIYEGNNEYLNKQIKNSLFKTKTLFEPFMSLELISNDNKDYLNDILMYKYLYQNYLTKKEKEKIKLHSIFESLIQSSQKLDD